MDQALYCQPISIRQNCLFALNENYSIHNKSTAVSSLACLSKKYRCLIHAPSYWIDSHLSGRLQNKNRFACCNSFSFVCSTQLAQEGFFPPKVTTPYRSNLLSVILNNNEIRVFFVGVKKRDDIRRHGSNSTTHMTVVFRRETRKQYFSGVFCSWELAAANCVYLSRLSLCSLEIEQE